MVPDHAPVAVQDAALLVDQVSSVLLPLGMVLGEAVNTIVGSGGLTETVVDCDALPPAPLQVRVNVEFEVRAPVDCDPLVGRVPDQAPEAVHEVALVEVQVSVVLLPLVTLACLAFKLTVGEDALTDTVVDCETLPPGPLHVSA